MFDGLYQSVICFFFPYLLYKRNGVVTKNGMGLEHRYYVGIIVTTIAVFACNLYILIHQYRWDWFSGFFIFLSCIVVIGWTGIWTSSFTSLDLWKAGERIYDSPSFWAVFFIGVFFCLLPRFTWDCYTQFFNPSDVQIIREMWKRGDYDHYPVGYDPTDPNRPKISKGAKFGERLGQGIVLEDETYAGGNVSRDSVFTEEIPMNIISGTDGTPRGFEMSGRTPDIPQTQWESPEREEQNLLNSPQANVGLGTFEQTVRQSIDRTRDSMLANRELDNRYSVDRARASLDLPGVTHAAALMEERKSREFR